MLYSEYEKCAKILGLSPYSDIKEIKNAYKKLVVKYHPDKIQNPTKKLIAEQKFKQINNAYHFLLDNYLIVGSDYRTGNFYAKSDYSKQNNSFQEKSKSRRKSRYFSFEENDEPVKTEGIFIKREMPIGWKIIVVLFFNVLSFLWVLLFS